MTPGRWRQLEELYDAVVNLPAAERRLRLQDADPELRSAVEAILTQNGSALERPAWERHARLLETAETRTNVPGTDDATITDLAPGTLIGRYQIEALLGEGGMGQVFRARDTRLGRTVALKVVRLEFAQRKDFRSRLEHEARASSALNHPNICALYDVGEHDGVPFLVMEYVEGETLTALLKKGRPAVEDTLRYGVQIASALAAAHARNIVHRDLKPSNVMITPAGVKVLDFGIAKNLASDTDRVDLSTLTEPGQIVGTPAYMSPEQISGTSVDSRSDIFVLGVVLYEMLCGRRPFQGDTAVSTLGTVLHKSPDPPRSLQPDIPEPLERVVMRCLRKAPSERFESVAEVRVALELLAAKPAQQQPSIAVLPFANMSRDPDDEYFSDGLAEEILNVLAHIPGLKVIARTSSFAFRGKEQDITQIAEALRVRTILEGSVRRAGSRIRVTMQLIDASDGSHLWSERYDRELKDVFAVQDEIAAAIAGALHVKLVGNPAETWAHQPDLPAYEAFLKGRHQMFKASPEGYARAREYFEQAIALDPEYAEPHGELASYFFFLGFWSLRPAKEVMPLARAEARRALELSPADPQAHSVLSVVAAMHDHDWTEAEKQYRLALAADSIPPVVRSLAAIYLTSLGRFEAALREIEIALRQDPLNVFMRRYLTLVLTHAGLYDAAIAEAQKTLEIEEGHWSPYGLLAFVYAAKKMFAEAREPAETAFRLAPWNPFVAGWLASILACLGEKDRADQLLAKIPETAPNGRVFYHTLRGEIDAAADWYEKDIELRQPTAAFQAAAAFHKPLRESPRWLKLAKMMNLPTKAE